MPPGATISLTAHAGDERPCQRCIKRGLQDACHDGVRKKAKYLHDAPAESLMPGMGVRGAGNRFQYVPNLPRGPPLGHEATYPGSSAGAAYALPLAVPTTFSMYASSAPPGQMPLALGDVAMSPSSYSAQVSPTSPHFTPGPSTQASPMQSMGGVLHQNPPTMPPMENPYSASIGDPHDPMPYSFDPASFNFGNHYGALEFGMLGHMSSGVLEPTSGDASGPLPAPGTGYATPGPAGYDGSPVHAPPFLYSSDLPLGEWGPDAAPAMRSASDPAGFPITECRPDPLIDMMSSDVLHAAYTIGAGSGSLTSPSASSSPPDAMLRMEDTSRPASRYPSHAAAPHPHDRPARPQAAPPMMATPRPASSTRPTRDPSSIYDQVKQPYPYMDGFHGLTAFLQKRFSPQKTLRIAKALASIRPSFIACTKTLNREDLIFMEKCFQRTLFEYEDFINACGTPTIVCRRTGEVAAVGKEFSLLTGWKKDVLLGNEPNLNVNTGQPSGPAAAPRLPGGARSEATDHSRPQPVFLAELLDDDSVIGFYEDFARLAFGDSRGSVTRQCNLLKYKTAAEYAAEADPTRNEIGGPGAAYGHGTLGIHRLGQKDGKVECSYCWTVKRDVFDIPMLIVMNVSHAFGESFPVRPRSGTDSWRSFYRVYDPHV